MDSKNIEVISSKTDQKHSTISFQIILIGFSIASLFILLGFMILPAAKEEKSGPLFLFLSIPALLSLLISSFMSFGTSIMGIVENTPRLQGASEKRREVIVEIIINFGILAGIVLLAIIFIKHMNGVFAL